MNFSDSATALTDDAPPAGAADCFHCGLPVTEPGRYRVQTGGAWQPVCCAGCEAVASAILGYGLEKYYRHRTAKPPTPQATDAAEDLGIYDDAEVQRSFVHVIGPGEHEAALLLEGIRCSACVWLNESVVARQQGVLAVAINATTHRAHVRWDPQRVKLSQILSAMSAIGYRAHPYDVRKQEQNQQDEQRRALWRLFVSGFGMMQVMMYALPAYLAEPGGMTDDIAQLMRWASLALTVPVVTYSAAPFFQAAWRDLRLKRAGMDLPVALGIAVAFAASLYATLTGGGDVYFDSISMFVFLLLCGRYVEMRARHAAARSLDYLSRSVPEFAIRIGADGAAKSAPVTSLRPGDRVLVGAGERVPADGVMEEGRSFLDESLLTGESRAVARQGGDSLLGGSTNVGNPLVLHVERIGTDTVLSSIVRLVEQAAASRPPLAAMADRISAWFVAAVIFLAVAAGTIWWAVDPQQAVWIAISILVVTCPCALSLATPFALTVATGRLARAGLITCREHTIEAMARATDVVIDKTGTLTEGRLQLLFTRTFAEVGESECLRIAAVLEQGSIHPIARAITTAAKAGTSPSAAPRHVAGRGVEAQIEGKTYRLGKPEFVLSTDARIWDRDLPPGSSVAVLGDGRRCLALFAFGDRLRADAAGFVDSLQRSGKRVHLLSGDRSEVVLQTAAELGISEFRANATPADKLDYVRELQRHGALVAMIGDGINDAPVLTQADVSIAMGDGAWMSQREAGAVLLSGRLEALAAGFAITARTLAVIRENLFWALAYNLTAIPLAAFGLVTPWMAGIGMSASSLVVILNSLRLYRGPRRRAAAPMPALAHGAG